MHVCPCRLHIEGSQLERCISSMICSRDIPFWSETLDIILCLQASNPQLMFMCAPVWNVIWCYRSPILTCGLCVHHRRSYCSEWLLVSNPNLVSLCTSELTVQCGVHFCQCILCSNVCVPAGVQSLLPTRLYSVVYISVSAYCVILCVPAGVQPLLPTETRWQGRCVPWSGHTCWTT